MGALGFDWIAIVGLVICVIGYGYVIGTCLHDWALAYINTEDDPVADVPADTVDRLPRSNDPEDVLHDHFS